MYVVAFVGDSGTGKSYRAFMVAEKYKMEAIVDDGLLISGGRIIAGYSAKNEPNMIKAVKRAVFKDQKHAEMVSSAICSENINRILVIGTSLKMVEQIAKSLNLNKPAKVVYIDEIASKKEILEAKRLRAEGKHIIPVPVVELKSHFFGSLMDKARIFIMENKNKLISKVDEYNECLKDNETSRYKQKKWVEKSIVRPKFSYFGRLIIADEAIYDLCMYIVFNNYKSIKLMDVKIKRTEGQIIALKLSISMSYGDNIRKVAEKLQREVKEGVSFWTGIMVSCIDIFIEKIVTKGSGGFEVD